MLPEREHKITPKHREKLIQSYANTFPISDYKPNIFRFHAIQVRELLDQAEAVEFVIEKGLDDKGIEVQILTCKDKDGEELPMILEVSIPCPPVCN